PIVFLVDGGSKAFVTSHVPKLRLLPRGDIEVPAWLPSSALANSVTALDDARLQQATEEEYRRLLYVGMTRAADRLIICGYRGTRAKPDTWHTMIGNALCSHPDHCSTATFTGPAGEWGGLRWRRPRAAETASRAAAGPVEHSVPAPRPDALAAPRPPAASLPRPRSPSGAGTLIEDAAADLIMTSPLFGESSN